MHKFQQLFSNTQYDVIHSDPQPNSRVCPRGNSKHRVEGLGLDKKHIKFQLSSIKGAQVMTSKRNAAVNVNVNLNVNIHLTLATNVT